MENNFRNFISSIKGKQVIIWGLGLNQGGLGAAKFFARRGARIKIVDPKSKEELKNSSDALRKFSNVEFVFGNQDELNFKNADLVIKNQAIPWDNPLVKKLLKKGISVERDITLFFRFFKGKTVGVTGSKGKTTTTTLISQLLKQGGKNILIGGNIQVSLFDFFSKKILEDKKRIAVLELSSFQLEDLERIRRSPNVAVVTNILRDHLNRYGSYAKYVAAKKNIYLFQGKGDSLVLNREDKKTRDFKRYSKAKILFFSSSRLSSSGTIKNPVLISKNNKSNLAAAITVADIFKIRKSIVEKVIKNFKGVPYRMEKIAVIRGVTFINDTTATIPDSAINNLKLFGKKVILISGGADKNLKFASFAKKVAVKTKQTILLPGTATPLIIESLKKYAPQTPITEVGSMDKAVKTAYKKAILGDVILLSPGCASFGIFKNEFDRGDQFNEAVKKLK